MAFCQYCEIAPYSSFCQCNVSNDICPLVYRCAEKMCWKPLSSMENCRLRKERENMFKHKIRFCKHNQLYIENGDCVLLVENPFGDKIPDGVDKIVEIDGNWYVGGYEPKPVKSKVDNDAIINPKSSTKVNKDKE